MTAQQGVAEPRTAGRGSAQSGREAGWATVAGQECRDLWVGGRGPLLVFAFCCLLSVITYLSATNQVLNFLEQRETVNLVLQLAVAVGVLLTMIVSADAVSGERERGTLETILLSPVSRRAILIGKLVAALSLWLALLAAAVPYLWVLGRSVSVFGSSVLLGLTVGTLLALAMACLGLLISGLASSNKVSLASSLFLLLILYAPTQLPTGAQQGFVGDVILRINPIASGERYIGPLVLNDRSWTTGLDYLISPLLTAGVAAAVLLLASDRLLALDRRAGAP